MPFPESATPWLRLLGSAASAALHLLDDWIGGVGDNYTTVLGTKRNLKFTIKTSRSMCQRSRHLPARCSVQSRIGALAVLFETQANSNVPSDLNADEPCRYTTGDVERPRTSTRSVWASPVPSLPERNGRTRHTHLPHSPSRNRAEPA
jgi:hypothetical protein